MKKLLKTVFVFVFHFMCFTMLAQPPAPAGFRWVKNEAMSDEFKGNRFNRNSKWKINDPSWPGRAPGLFMKRNVNQWGGQLKMTAELLKPNERFPVKNPGCKPNRPCWKTWTHGGALVWTKAKQRYGYFETRMKANETFMSSTFWLLHRPIDGGKASDCSLRTTEADITENVGFKMPAAANFVHKLVNGQVSTMHSRAFKRLPKNCRRKSWVEKFVQKNANYRKGSNKSFNGFHTYGMWWKGPRELILYLDGVRVNTIRPTSDFNIPMAIFLVVETYDWNPAPQPNQNLNAGGMNKNFNARTTDYEYVRSWRLVRNRNLVKKKHSGGGKAGSIPYGKEIAIRSLSGGGNPFLQVNPNARGNLSSTGGTTPPNQAWKTWERFVPKRHPNGQTAIYSLANNRYLQVNGSNKSIQVRANGPAKTARPKGWERFEWRGLGGRRFALRSTVRALAPTQWLQRRPNAKGVFPNGARPRGWETFEYVVLPNQRGRKELNGEVSLGLEVYPNPVNVGDNILIDSQLPKVGEVSATIYDLSGAKVYENNSDNVQVGATLSISTANLTPGVYIVKVISNGVTETQKIVVK